jgi:hypothetical protein
VPAEAVPEATEVVAAVVEPAVAEAVPATEHSAAAAVQTTPVAEKPTQGL